MGVIVIEGVVISIRVLTGLREMIMNAIPMDLKLAIGIGIGLFLAIIGFVNGGIVVVGEGTPIMINPDLTTLRFLTYLVTFLICAALVARNVKGALLIGIVSGTVFAIVLNAVWGDDAIWAAVGPGIAQVPSDIVASPNFSLVGDFNFGVFSAIGLGLALPAILAVMLSDFFDTMGTAVGLGEEAGLLDENGRLPGIKNVLLVDGLAAAAGGAASASSNTTFIESGAGIGEGGRTGFASIITGALFLLAIFFSPIAAIVPPEATAPVLVIVGYFMMKSVGRIDWRDPGIGIPALLTMTLMPFTYNITNGIGAGFIAYTAIRVLQGRWRDVHPLMYGVSIVFVYYFWKGFIA
jgi:AGZA family xanthine/uracil permease-like MFS transporter